MESRGGEHYCRHCGVRLRRVLGRWYHVQQIGLVRCERPEPEPSPPGAAGT